MAQEQFPNTERPGNWGRLQFLLAHIPGVGHIPPLGHAMGAGAALDVPTRGENVESFRSSWCPPQVGHWISAGSALARTIFSKL